VQERTVTRSDRAFVRRVARVFRRAQQIAGGTDGGASPRDQSSEVRSIRSESVSLLAACLLQIAIFQDPAG